jgi:hypothetical protein
VRRPKLPLPYPNPISIFFLYGAGMHRLASRVWCGHTAVGHAQQGPPWCGDAKCGRGLARRLGQPCSMAREGMAGAGL